MVSDLEVQFYALVVRTISLDFFKPLKSIMYLLIADKMPAMGMKRCITSRPGSLNELKQILCVFFFSFSFFFT